MANKEALNRLLYMAKKGCKVDMCNVKYVENASDIIKKDLELLAQLEILKNYYPPFKEFLEEMFKNGYNEDLTKIKEWLENDK